MSPPRVILTAGSVSGTLSRDPSSANHPLTNSFDAQKMQNGLQIQQVGSQVVGEVGGLVADTLHNAGVSGFDETNWKDNYGRALLEAAGSAGVAALGHGNVAASGVGTAIAGIATSAALPSAAAWAVSETKDRNTQIALANIITNTVASAAGAVGGLAAGGSTSIDALTGAAAASAIQQNNMSQQMAVAVEMAEIASKVLEGVPNPIVKGVGVVLDAGTAIYVAHNALANHLPDRKGTTVNSKNNEVTGNSPTSGSGSAASAAMSESHTNGQDTGDSTEEGKTAAQHGNTVATGAPDPEGKEPSGKDGNSDINKIKEIISDSKIGKTTKGKTTQYEREGGFDQANSDFDQMELKDIKIKNTTRGILRVGKMSDGKIVIVRPFSSEGRPTLEIRNPGNGRGIEIRYD